MKRIKTTPSMPHTEYMDDHGITYENLSDRLQSRLRIFHEMYDEALKDDWEIDPEEERLLTAESYIIKQEIEQYINEQNDDNSGGGIIVGVTLGILGLIGLAVGAKQIKQ